MGNNKLTHTIELRVEGQGLMKRHIWVITASSIMYEYQNLIQYLSYWSNIWDVKILTETKEKRCCYLIFRKTFHVWKKKLCSFRAENTKCISVSCWIMYNWWRSKSEAAEYHLPRCRVHFLQSCQSALIQKWPFVRIYECLLWF